MTLTLGARKLLHHVRKLENKYNPTEEIPPGKNTSREIPLRLSRKRTRETRARVRMQRRVALSEARGFFIKYDYYANKRVPPEGRKLRNKGCTRVFNNLSLHYEEVQAHFRAAAVERIRTYCAVMHSWRKTIRAQSITGVITWEESVAREISSSTSVAINPSAIPK